jgi:hypothetical protein
MLTKYDFANNKGRQIAWESPGCSSSFSMSKSNPSDGTIDIEFTNALAWNFLVPILFQY